MRQRLEVREEPADTELARLAGAGDLDAFDVLYRRHVEAAWRMALAVTSNPHDAADAVSDAFTRVFQALPNRPQAAGHFLPYLLAAVRNAAIDGLRRDGRQRATSPGDHPEWASLGAEPGDDLVADVEASLVSQAFKSLPERWRSVLWLVEIERFSLADVALLLGMTPNGVAQLAVRARTGLRQRYLQAHLRQTEVRTSCRHTVGRLGAYAAGGLAPRDLSKVDQHLAGCDACRSRLAQLQDVTPCLRRAVLPLPAALAALSAAKLHLAAGGATAGAAAVSATAVPAGIGAGVVAAVAPAPLVASLASAALLVAGFVGVGVVERQQDRDVSAAAAAAAPAQPDVTYAAASAPPGSPPAPMVDPVTGLLRETAPATTYLDGLTDAVDSLGREVANLPAAAPELLAAAAAGDVRIDTEAAAAKVDLRDGPQPCPTFRVLGVRVRCQSGAGAAVVAPADPGAPADAGTATPAPAGPAARTVPIGDGLVLHAEGDTAE